MYLYFRVEENFPSITTSTQQKTHNIYKGSSRGYVLSRRYSKIIVHPKILKSPNLRQSGDVNWDVRNLGNWVICIKGFVCLDCPLMFFSIACTQLAVFCSFGLDLIIFSSYWWKRFHFTNNNPQMIYFFFCFTGGMGDLQNLSQGRGEEK